MKYFLEKIDYNFLITNPLLKNLLPNDTSVYNSNPLYFSAVNNNDYEDFYIIFKPNEEYDGYTIIILCPTLYCTKTMLEEIIYDNKDILLKNNIRLLTYNNDTYSLLDF